MKWLRAPFIAAAALLALAAPAWAVVCTGTTTTLASGGTVPASFLLTPGNCVAAGDKIFGEASISGALTGTGSASFSFLTTPGNVTVGFAGTVGPSLTGSLSYAVAVDPALAAGFLIDDLQKDFTLNANLTGAFATATLTGATNPASIAFSCTRTVNPETTTCPQTAIFTPVAQMTVSETITTGPNAIVTALTDTISQARPIPEPNTLAILGAALTATGLLSRRRRRNP